MALTNQIQFKTLTQLVVEMLREKIISGEIITGARIQQDKLAQEFNVSKNPVREALIILQAEGFIDNISNKGAVVASISAEQIDELFMLRVLIETDLLIASLKNISLDKLKEAQHIITQLNSDSSVNVWCKLHTQYFNCLYSGIERPQTQEMLNFMNNKIEKYNRLRFGNVSIKTHLKHCLKQLLNYCIEGKVEQAVLNLKQHILSTRDEIKVIIMPK